MFQDNNENADNLRKFADKAHAKMSEHCVVDSSQVDTQRQTGPNSSTGTAITPRSPRPAASIETQEEKQVDYKKNSRYFRHRLSVVEKKKDYSSVSKKSRQRAEKAALRDRVLEALRLGKSLGIGGANPSARKGKAAEESLRWEMLSRSEQSEEVNIFNMAYEDSIANDGSEHAIELRQVDQDYGWRPQPDVSTRPHIHKTE